MDWEGLGTWGPVLSSALYAGFLPKVCAPTGTATHPLPQQGFLFFFSFGGLLRRVAILPRVVFTLIITQGLEDALYGGIADGLLGYLVDGLLGHFYSHFLWGGGPFPED